LIHAWTRINFALAIALTSVVIAVAQESANPTAGPKSTLNTTQALDQLIEQNQQLEKQNQQIEKQNQQLEKQNQELMEQIKALRGAGAQGVSASVSEQAAEAPSAQANAGQETDHTGQSSPQGPNEVDDLLLP